MWGKPGVAQWNVGTAECPEMNDNLLLKHLLLQKTVPESSVVLLVILFQFSPLNLDTGYNLVRNV